MNTDLVEDSKPELFSGSENACFGPGSGKKKARINKIFISSSRPVDYGRIDQPKFS